ncbi:DegV family protein [Lactiplantibacillus mudanjiangensis]|uniref:DegV family protein [Lactobacillus sp.] n=1 Tax=Lactiplantibacillus mudanjiangensis TaxID=1296538 RepID=A0A660E0L4_9LACO|nr:DegV family protein [Lactiplantibacillus mudanjiangensis]VDG19460.1 DegV family protein [Lactobacillus sp.] [Lactiplantibacillus mudanjiangensis]VDG25156.1 DegV family protein [Lactobacillus sp.] [Lactiplantibacillus mudanjiangensis]VDG27958.1 DegV family protein [Lactobacillus sp.] [Lactiplantibacillus mudanjiangensis]VDG30912.1 DegV family protein [Lactobacillus sp.] [Lactiplantibacillus mudanjiangensis]
MKIAVVTDSTSYLTPQEVADNDIHVVPIPVIIDGKVYQEGVDITTKDFYANMKSFKSFPSTSQPPVGEMIEFYNRLGDQGYDAVISIHLASTISGFYNSLENMRDAVDKIKLYPYDSQITVRLMGYLAIEAARMAKAGATVEAILARLDDLRASMGEYFIVDDLQNLVRGGRLSNASAFIGSVLRIKPILTFDEKHEIVAFEKVRSTKKALARVEHLFAEAQANLDYPLRAIIVQGNNLEAAEAWKQKLQQDYPDMPIDITYFGPVIGAHLGDKSLALAWLKDIDKAY